MGAAILLFASLLQFHQLGRDQRFLPDEAWFMTFARGAAVNGDWLLPGDLDKPPLSIYLSALSMVAVGIHADETGALHLEPRLGEFAGKLPNAVLALLLTAMMLRLTYHVYRDAWAGVFAGLLTAGSPYVISLGASAFTDMSLLFFTVLALYLALKRRWLWAGLALGMALWCKQQAVFSLALVLALALRNGLGRRDWLKFLAMLSLCLGALLVWDAARGETSIFLQAAANNAPQDFIAAPATWIERAATWLSQAMWLLGPPPMTALILLLVSLSLFDGRILLRHSSAFTRILVMALLVYFSLHVVISFNLYDRYMLLALPLVILLVAGGLAQLSRALARYRFGRIAALLLLLAGLWSMTGGLTIGGEREAYTGIDGLAAHLKSKPVATVVYDPWLGWQLGYYLGQWHDKRRVHYPTAEALAAGALELDEIGARYLVAPSEQPHQDWLAALRDAGFAVAQDYAQDSFVVYRLLPP